MVRHGVQGLIAGLKRVVFGWPGGMGGGCVGGHEAGTIGSSLPGLPLVFGQGLGEAAADTSNISTSRTAAAKTGTISNGCNSSSTGRTAAASTSNISNGCNITSKQEHNAEMA